MRIHTPAARVGVGKVRGRHTAVTAGQGGAAGECSLRKQGKDYPGGKGHLSAFCFTFCETDTKEEGSLHAPHICSTRMSKTRVSRSQSLFPILIVSLPPPLLPFLFFYGKAVQRARRRQRWKLARNSEADGSLKEQWIYSVTVQIARKNDKRLCLQALTCFVFSCPIFILGKIQWNFYFFKSKTEFTTAMFFSRYENEKTGHSGPVVCIYILVPVLV